ncbi:MAG TPA: hypothetical protein VFN60_03305, partial [Acidimicrobiales bacterium]|nr:hypothetical protein [Acidimicrobiales bacterium]
WRCWSHQAPGGPQPVEVGLDELGPGSPSGWARYVAGVAWAFGRRGIEVPGADLLLDSTVPVGSGLSSSAALTGAVAVAIDDLTGARLERSRLVGVCHDAEALFVGAPTGTLDQTAVLLAEEGSALCIDFARGSATPVPLAGAGPLAVVDTGVRHAHAEGAYGERRRECEAAAGALGVARLSAADPASAERLLEGRLAARARHVLTENARVEETVRRLRSGEDIGELLMASHRSLRDDFEASCSELDAVVDAARAAGAAGARMTGGGFGGSVIVLGLTEADLRPAATAALAPFGRVPAGVFAAVPSGPAGRLL